MILPKDEPVVLALQNPICPEVLSPLLDRLRRRRSRFQTGRRSFKDHEAVLGVLPRGLRAVSLTVQFGLSATGILLGRKRVENRKAKHRKKRLDGAEVVPKLCEHRLGNVRLRGRLAVLEPEALGLLRRPDAVVFQAPGVGLCETAGLRRDGDGRRPEVFVPVMPSDPL
ncbi:hypothetical protein [Salinibacter ruber]|uniref:hypothetical protein n=1 Tax=Salinibacter ruber TaxID=146919 RepID=UPI00216A00F8